MYPKLGALTQAEGGGGGEQRKPEAAGATPTRYVRLVGVDEHQGNEGDSAAAKEPPAPLSNGPVVSVRTIGTGSGEDDSYGHQQTGDRDC